MRVLLTHLYFQRIQQVSVLSTCGVWQVAPTRRLLQLLCAQQISANHIIYTHSMRSHKRFFALFVLNSLFSFFSRTRSYFYFLFIFCAALSINLFCFIAIWFLPLTGNSCHRWTHYMLHFYSHFYINNKQQTTNKMKWNEIKYLCHLIINKLVQQHASICCCESWNKSENWISCSLFFFPVFHFAFNFYVSNGYKVKAISKVISKAQKSRGVKKCAVTFIFVWKCWKRWHS